MSSPIVLGADMLYDRRYADTTHPVFTCDQDALSRVYGPPGQQEDDETDEVAYLVGRGPSFHSLAGYSPSVDECWEHDRYSRTDAGGRVQEMIPRPRRINPCMSGGFKRFSDACS